MPWYGKQKLLYYCGEIVANYKIYCENDNHCEVVEYFKSEINKEAK